MICENAAKHKGYFSPIPRCPMFDISPFLTIMKSRGIYPRYRHSSEEVRVMKLELTNKQFRRLLDMAYIGNWILNSTRGDDRFRDYDEVESLLFAKAREEGMGALAED